MAKFLLMYTGGNPDTPPAPEESAAIFKDWTDWFTTFGENLVDAGNPTTPMAKTIARDGAVSAGGPGEMVTGYSIIQAGSLDAAAEAAMGRRSSRLAVRSSSTRPSTSCMRWAALTFRRGRGQAN
jgi:hypothetical protein